MATSCIISEIKRLIEHRDFFMPPFYITIHIFVLFFAIEPDLCCDKQILQIFCLFTAQARYRQTDGQTDRQTDRWKTDLNSAEFTT